MIGSITPAAAGLAMVAAGLAVAGWLTDTLQIAKVSSGYIPMAPSTAICFLLLSSIIFFRRWRPDGMSATLVMRLMALLVLVLGAAILIEFIVEAFTDLAADVEGWLVEGVQDPGGFTTGRMSPLTATLFILLAANVVLSRPVHDMKRFSFLVAQGFAVAVLTIAGLLLVGYWYREPLLYGGDVTPVALPSAAAFFLLSLALLSESPQAWIYRWYDSRSVAARFTRLVVPAAAIGILIVGWLHQLTDIIDTSLEFSLVALLIAGIVTLLTILAARRIQGVVDAGERSLRVRRDFAEGLIESLQDGFSVIAPDGERMMVNQALSDMTGLSREELMEQSPPFAYWPPEYEEQITRAFNAMLKGEMEATELVFQRANGERFPVQLTPSFLRDAEGNLIASAMTIKDITERKRAEQALTESEERVRLALAAANQGFYDLNLQTGEAIVSPEYAMMLGFDPATFHETNAWWIERLHPDDREAVAENYRAYIAGEIPEYRVEFRQKMKSGGWKWILSIGSIVERDDAGEPLRMLGTHTDIDERRAAEAAILKRNRDLAVLLEVSEAFTATLDIDTVLGTIVESALELEGLQSGAIYLVRDEELYLGATIPPLPEEFPDEFRVAPIDDHPHIRRTLSDGRPVIVEDAASADLSAAEREIIEARGLRTLIYLPLLVEQRTVGILVLGTVETPRPVTEEEINLYLTLAGQAALVIENARLYGAVKQELAERVEAEAALAESEERYRNIVETTPMGMHMYQLGEDGRLVFTGANPAADLILGVDNSQFVGKTIEAAFPLLEMTEVPERYREAARDGTPWYTEQIEYREGEISGAFEVYAFQAEPMKMVALFNDITARKQAEEERQKLLGQLAQAQKMESVGRLAGGIAHDFNNMLGVIMGHAEIAKTQIDPQDPLREDLEAINKAARRSADLTRQLLAFARRQATSPRVIKIDDTVGSMLDMLRRMIGEEIKLEWQPQAVWPVKIDPSQVDQVMANLLVNARDAIDGAGTVALALENVTIDDATAAETPGLEAGDYVRIAVRDDGRGMDAEVLGHVFEPFFTTKGLAEGTGLGLSTVYGIVKQNNGFVSVDSEPGQGTTIMIYLRRFIGSPADTPGRAEEPQRGQGETILLVEDEPTVLRMTDAMLRRLDYEVITCSSPDEAVDIARENRQRIDLLLTDVVMPGMSGRELADQVAEIIPGIGILFMSGYTADIISKHGVIDEDIGFLQKPFTAERLGAIIREVLDGDES